jgi:phosphocarrier protein
MVSKKIIIKNYNGLHIKPAGALSNIALKFSCKVYLKVRTYNVNAKSVLGVLSAQVRQNEEIEIICDGLDEEECLNAIISAASEKFFVE